MVWEHGCVFPAASSCIKTSLWVRRENGNEPPVSLGDGPSVQRGWWGPLLSQMHCTVRGPSLSLTLAARALVEFN
jgi:hypothetical protein